MERRQRQRVGRQGWGGGEHPAGASWVPQWWTLGPESHLGPCCSPDVLPRPALAEAGCSALPGLQGRAHLKRAAHYVRHVEWSPCSSGSLFKEERNCPEQSLPFRWDPRLKALRAPPRPETICRQLLSPPRTGPSPVPGDPVQQKSCLVVWAPASWPASSTCPSSSGVR